MNESPLICDCGDETISILTLNRPDKRNALSIELMESVCQEFERLSVDATCRVVLLRGAGPVFCAGLDLVEAAEASVAERSAECLARMFETVVNSPLVTIAAAHGAAYAGGAGLMSVCDFAVASDDLRIAFPEVRLGLVPALVSVILRDRLRDSEMRELYLLGEPIDARRALDLGLVHSVVAPDRVLETALQIADTIRKGAPLTVRDTKRLLREIHSLNGADLMSLALEAHQRARNSDEAREGIAAFREHRAPVWNSK
jgi:methylglutaconyl-CoA hydratase